MQIHRNLDQLPEFRNAVVTIGTFDGVHAGHRQIIDELIREARSVNGETVIITFHPHPRKVVTSAILGVRLINTPEEKLELLEQLGIDHVVVVPFTDAFANQSAEDYVENFLVKRFHPHTVIIGYDHRFGKERKGDYRLLEQLAPRFGYQLREIPKHILDEIAISSTRIREALLEGRVSIADKLLGYDFFFSGVVVHGDKLGRELGYPTANIHVPDEEKIIPGNGIYAVYAALTHGEPASSRLKGMMSIGFRPTVDGKRRVIEVNLFDFNQDIYGKTIRIFIKKYLREEIKFDSLEALVKQIDQDKIDSLNIL
ncbi:bifunctional riboflavin kinase/FAD synthetase [Terrimonas sp. NA20]|uniref:Riboflavin biosynthesis protein n=1 Tax=Terrimonas ginsenosidimutans TaxID=2908004 RepID=A0ABS9KWG0_9BACT|nr:bifunctional riboflavin kinase/FAD synthetase [Terrimonas ginsenosidimutans]MCG2616651.1 bifunctional riboflavin kinase/FAD synthetase [Terrimonas ginsenosidimutans]